jgi:hypothetical protein
VAELDQDGAFGGGDEVRGEAERAKLVGGAVAGTEARRGGGSGGHGLIVRERAGGWAEGISWYQRLQKSDHGGVFRLLSGRELRRIHTTILEPGPGTRSWNPVEGKPVAEQMWGPEALTVLALLEALEAKDRC